MRKLTGVLVLLVALISGCTSVQPHQVSAEEKRSEERPLIIYGCREHLVPALNICIAVSKLPKVISDHLPPFYVVSEEAMPRFQHNGQVREAAGMYCLKEKRILIRCSPASSVVIWHESFHAYDDYLLESGKSRIQFWRGVSGNIYEDDDIGSLGERNCLEDGLLNDYSRKDPGEDRAELYAHCRYYLDGSPFEELLRQPGVKGNLKLLAKLFLLKDEGLFTDAEFKKLRPMFEDK